MYLQLPYEQQTVITAGKAQEAALQVPVPTWRTGIQLWQASAQ